MSARILDECFDSILAQRPDLQREASARTTQLMNKAAPDGLVEGFEDVVDGLTLPDPEDRQVLAAAIRTGAHSRRRAATCG